MTHILDLLGGPGGAPSKLDGEAKDGKPDINEAHQEELSALFAGVYTELSNTQKISPESITLQGKVGAGLTDFQLSQLNNAAALMVSPNGEQRAAVMDPSLNLEKLQSLLNSIGTATPNGQINLGPQLQHSTPFAAEFGEFITQLNAMNSAAGNVIQPVDAPVELPSWGQELAPLTPSLQKGMEPALTPLPNQNFLSVIAANNNTPRDVEILDRVDLDAIDLDLKIPLAKSEAGTTVFLPVSAAQPIAQLSEQMLQLPATGPGAEQALSLATPVQSSGTSSSAAQPIMAHNVAAQISQAVANVRTTAEQMEVMLDPPELGRVYIDFNFDGDRIVGATISAEQTDTASLMKKHTEILMKELADAGFDGVELSFQDHTDRQFAGQEQQGPSSLVLAPSQEYQATEQLSLAQALIRSELSGLDLRL